MMPFGACIVNFDVNFFLIICFLAKASYAVVVVPVCVTLTRQYPPSYPC